MQKMCFFRLCPSDHSFFVIFFVGVGGGAGNVGKILKLSESTRKRLADKVWAPLGHERKGVLFQGTWGLLVFNIQMGLSFYHWLVCRVPSILFVITYLNQARGRQKQIGGGTYFEETKIPS